MRAQKNKGAALMLVVIFFTLASFIATVSIGRTAYYDALRFRTLEESKQAFFAAQSSMEDAVYRIRNGESISATEVLTVNGAFATATIASVYEERTVTVRGVKNNMYRSGRAELHLGDGASFNFGLQSDTGGITLANSATVIGNIYSNGSVIGTGVGLGSTVQGDVVSSGPAGLIRGIYATSSAWAHTIDDTTVTSQAHYQTILGSTVSGAACPNANCFPGSEDQPISTLPLSEATVLGWEADAEAGGLYSGTCPYLIDSDTTLGPIKIPCDVEVDKSSTDVTLAGPVWITGNLETKNGPNFHVSGVPGVSTLIITDDPTNRATSSMMDLDQSTGFIGTSGDSYVLMISMNSGSASGTSETAISAGNKTVPGQREVIYYAPYGKITASQSVKMRGATAHHINLTQSASVEYETGMISLLFQGGVGGSFLIDSWAEVE